MPSSFRCLLPYSRREAPLDDWGLQCVEGVNTARRSQREPIRTHRYWHGVNSPADCGGQEVRRWMVQKLEWVVMG